MPRFRRPSGCRKWRPGGPISSTSRAAGARHPWRPWHHFSRVVPSGAWLRLAAPEPALPCWRVDAGSQRGHHQAGARVLVWRQRGIAVDEVSCSAVRRPAKPCAPPPPQVQIRYQPCTFGRPWIAPAGRAPVRVTLSTSPSAHPPPPDMRRSLFLRCTDLVVGRWLQISSKTAATRPEACRSGPGRRAVAQPPPPRQDRAHCTAVRRRFRRRKPLTPAAVVPFSRRQTITPPKMRRHRAAHEPIHRWGNRSEARVPLPGPSSNRPS